VITKRVSEVIIELIELDTEISLAVAYWHKFYEYYAPFFNMFHSLRHVFIQM